MFCSTLISMGHWKITSWIRFISIASFIYMVEGTCVVDEYVHQSGSVWQPEPCVSCTCQSPVAVCEPVQCQDPHCHFDQGETLWIPGDECCPKCVQKASNCQLREKTVAHNHEWSTGPCQTCVCNDGVTQCNNITCKSPQCGAGEVLQTLPSMCCPQCVPVGRSCTYQGETYRDGTDWSPLPCTKCSCRDGAYTCYTAECPQLYCKQSEEVYRHPVECCPKCVGQICQEDGQIFQDGAHWQRDRCTHCVCQAGSVSCMRSSCQDTHCPEGQHSMWKPDRCCPMCVDDGETCHSEDEAKNPGEVWQLSPCEYCMCHQGAVSCHKVQCQRPKCKQDEVLEEVAGVCCPKCVSKAGCIYERLNFQHNDTWEPDPCHTCECLDGKVSCFSLSCPICPKGSVRVNVAGQCCGQCKPVMCNPECLNCDAVNPNQCKTCPPGTFLQLGRCLSECQDGFFPHPGGICQVCHQSCVTCTGGSPYHCDICLDHLLWKYGQCVGRCGDGFYENSGGCQRCPPGCVKCSSMMSCDKCDNEFSLLNGLCIDRCGPPQQWDQYTQTCMENEYAPILFINNTIEGFTRRRTTLNSGMLQVYDSDTPYDQLTFHILRLPTNGKLWKIVEGQNELISERGIFSTVDVLDGKILFEYDKMAPLKGILEMWASDGQLGSQRQVIPITVSSELSPQVVRNTPLFLETGDMGIISSSTNMAIVDEDSPSALKLEILQGPAHGVLTKRNTKEHVSERTVLDLDMGLEYQHDGSNSKHDYILLQATDATNSINTLFTIEIKPKGSSEPIVVSNNGAFVDHGGMVEITSEMLMSKPGTKDSHDVIYTLVPSDSNPKYGEIRMVVPVPRGGVREGWIPLGDGHMYVKMYRFLQRDITEGRIYYQHNSAYDKPSDTMIFELSDTAIPPNVLSDQEFHITILKEEVENAAQEGVPTIGPGVQLGMTVFENQVVPITSADLAFFDVDTDDTKIVYQVTRPLGPQEGTLEHTQSPSRPVESFTQQDLNLHHITYRPPTEDIGQNKAQFDFWFTVTDGQNAHQLSEHKFMIEVLPVNNQPPFVSPSVPSLMVPQGGIVPVGPGVFTVEDLDSDLQTLTFTLAELPKAGDFMAVSNGFTVALRKGDQFTHEEFEKNGLHYSHDTSPVDDDEIQLSISDGIHITNVTVEVEILAVEDSAPAPDPDASMTMSLPEGHSDVIHKSQLSFTDPESSEEDTKIILASDPQHGILQGEGDENILPGHIFTQEDIDKMNIKYVAEPEVGSTPASDVIYFNVSNSKESVRPMQPFTITVTPEDNQPPVVRVGQGLKVQEGGRSPLSVKDIHVTDVDTDVKDLGLFLDSVPLYGNLINVRYGDGEAVKMFTLQDLIAGYIYYIQRDHMGKEPREDLFTFHVSDGIHNTDALIFNITIMPDNDEPVSLMTEQLFCQQHGGVVLGNSSLFAFDLDTPADQLIFTVLQAPLKGSMRRKVNHQDSLPSAPKLWEDHTFSYQDVLSGLIGYTHEGDSLEPDSMTLRVTDGEFSDIKALSIVIGVISEEAPRLKVNNGIRVQSGSLTIIGPADLKATDMDSDDHQLKFTLTAGPEAGRLKLVTMMRDHTLTPGGFDTFTQEDIDSGYLLFEHQPGEPGGVFPIKLSVSDPEGNSLLDQAFLITVIEDLIPPQVIVNDELQVIEGSSHHVTTDFLSARDQDSESASLFYTILQPPKLGRLAMVDNPEHPIVSFRQSDLAGRKLLYVHTSAEELYTDSFQWSLSDGTHEVMQTSYIAIQPVDDSLPIVTSQPLRVPRGRRKIISPFELKAEDPDTKEEKVEFMITRIPHHGTLELKTGDDYVPTAKFAMSDIYENRVSYRHDGTGKMKDSFMFVVSDGTNPWFTVSSADGQAMTSEPQSFQVSVLTVEDDSPSIITNLGLQYLEMMQDGRGTNFITHKELSATDDTSSPSEITYQIVSPPQEGFIEKTGHTGIPIIRFTQEDLNSGHIKYILNGSSSAVEDLMTFDLLDSSGNIVQGNQFHIQWSRIGFVGNSFNATETGDIIRVPIRRIGNLKQYAVVTCRTIPGRARSQARSHHPGHQDFVSFSGQVQFDVSQDTKTCPIIIKDDDVYEGSESFYVQLEEPTFSLLDDIQRATVNIYDPEDEPVLQFEYGQYSVNESSGQVLVSVVRKGDASASVSVICYTASQTATGSQHGVLNTGADFVTRPLSSRSRIVFPAGVTNATCAVTLIDDSEYETAEQFEVHLAEPSLGARLGQPSKALIFIEGPNDESGLHLSEAVFFVDEDVGRLSIPVIRLGGDLSHTSLVWCATHMTDPPSAMPGQDYLPSSQQLVFEPGQTTQMCRVTILDDPGSSMLEGNETFLVVLTTSMGSSLLDPHSALIIINDTTLDVPTVQFKMSSFVVDEEEKEIQVPILRTGDLTEESSVICYTRQETATAGVDYLERPLNEESRITFIAGEMVKNCTVPLIDDEVNEPPEVLKFHLEDPEGNLGSITVATVTITSNNDVPRVALEHAAYSIPEPETSDQSSTLTVRVIRTGEKNHTATVRCSTRDGSAISGQDYHARSRLLTFAPGEQYAEFSVVVLHNADVEWHETFKIILGPHEPTAAEFGNITMASITILDSEMSGSLVLPAPPVVVSLLDYEDVESGMVHDPSPGYPLICVTPCDLNFPNLPDTGPMCARTGINQSAIHYGWEVAIPTDSDGSFSSFVAVTMATPFTKPNEMVLDSIYFRPNFKVRCTAQPIHKNGNLGVPLKSKSITVGVKNGLCQASTAAGWPNGYHGQSFTANLKYVEPTDPDHPNTIHVVVKVPHQDGMLPLISTSPIHNLRYLMSEPAYRQQHVCSNFNTPQLTKKSDHCFLETKKTFTPVGIGYDEPYQMDASLRGNNTIKLYEHLNLKSCTWVFNAWYHMTELVDLCGGKVMSDFEVKESGRSYLSVSVPLYVSYVYTSAPSGWTAMDHRTEMHFSFFYNTMHWKAGLETEGKRSGKLQILKIGVGDRGNLVMDFKTQTKFRGLYVLEHLRKPDMKSKVIPPASLPLVFDLDLVWSQENFDGPMQLWKATSNLNMKDYSGDYIIELIPCTVSPNEIYSPEATKFCTPHQAERFSVPITFQQTNRPVPVEYSLATDFQLTNNRFAFLANPNSDEVHPTAEFLDIDFDGAFNEDDMMYGRVMWDPTQDLNMAYKLYIEKVYICSGKDGFIPTYDPTGLIYNEGPQFGCLDPSPYIDKHFLVLDRLDPHAVSYYTEGLDFGAKFSNDAPEFASMKQFPGVDGFMLNVKPLFELGTGQQWFVQVIYHIGPSDEASRFRRSALMSTNQGRSKKDAKMNSRKASSDSSDDVDDDIQNGTNMKPVRLKGEILEISGTETGSPTFHTNVTIPSVLAFMALIILLLFIMLLYRRKRGQRQQHNIKDISPPLQPSPHMCARVTVLPQPGVNTAATHSTSPAPDSTPRPKLYLYTSPSRGRKQAPVSSRKLDTTLTQTTYGSPTVRVKAKAPPQIQRFRWSRPKSGTEV